MTKYISFIFRADNRPIIAFICMFVLLFLGFYGFSKMYIGVVSPGGSLYSPFLHRYADYVHALRWVLIESSAWLLRLSGYEVATGEHMFKIIHGARIRVGYDCMGFGILSAWYAFIIAAFKRIPVVYLLAGTLLVTCLNILRIAIYGLALTSMQTDNFLIDQHTLFNIFIYTLLGLSFFILDKKGKINIV